MKRNTKYKISAGLLVALMPLLLLSANYSESGRVDYAVLNSAAAYRCSAAPRIDGNLNDDVWQSVFPITDFIQEYPENLAEPSEKTEVRILYDNVALYAGIRCFDSNPNLIEAHLAKRDDWMTGFEGTSDWFTFDIDSRYDHQTAFTFAVNAAGVQMDATVYDDADYDGEWNAVWQSEVAIDSLGWTIELAIPFSILRFSNQPTMIWGLNMERYIQRKNENITWVPEPWGVQGIASRYGTLSGLREIPTPKRLEIQPYLVSSNTLVFGDTLLNQDYDGQSRRSYRQRSTETEWGLDLKYGLGSNSTMDVTVNPDFGQIEADPDDINLTYYETWLPERRPFFMENATLMETPIELFYSRRIGANNDFIKTAVNFSGKNSTDLSYGVVGAVTTPEKKREWLDHFYGENQMYLASRIVQDLFEGNSWIGGTATFVEEQDTVGRALAMDSYFSLMDNRLTLDFQGAWSSTRDEIGIGFYSLASYQDPSFYDVWWEYEFYDDSFEINDLGFLLRNDVKNSEFGFGLRRQEPWSIWRYARVGYQFYVQHNMNDLLLEKENSLDFTMTFLNFWRLGGGVSHSSEHYQDKTTFDTETGKIGPSVKIPESRGAYWFLESDQRKMFCLKLSGGYGENELDDIGRSLEAELSIKPNNHIDIAMKYFLAKSFETYHWLEITEVFSNQNVLLNTHYMFSNSENILETSTLWLSGYLTRNLSVQFYSEYFSSLNEFDNYMELLYENGYPEETPYQPYSSNPFEDELLDHNLYMDYFSKYSSLNTNLALRWEYLPGSTVYLVWSQNRVVNGRRFDTFTDFLDYRAAGDWVEVTNTQSLAFKIEYWLNF